MDPQIEKRAEYTEHEYTSGDTGIVLREDATGKIVRATIHQPSGRTTEIYEKELQILLAALEKHTQ